MFVAKAGALPEGVKRGPEGFLGKFLVEDIHVTFAQWHACGHQFFIATGIDIRVGLEGALFRVVNRPGDPGTGGATGKETQQSGNDAVGGFGAAADQLTVFHHFLIGKAVVNHDQI